MKTHVFIVSDDTLPIHLHYLFAGTGARDANEHISLLSDITRARPGDLVIFYIEKTQKAKGRFYGIFQVAEQSPIVFHTPGDSGFQPSLSKKLIYRTLIEPYEVYSKGVPEWEALDKLPIYATELQWSLIYRKLKGGRGCTPLLPWEAERLMNIIRDKNSGKPIATASFAGGFDLGGERRNIVITKSPKAYSYPRNPTLEPSRYICELQEQGQAYEDYLQLYFVKNIGVNDLLTPIVGNNIIWFSNEVFCGVGMQKMDILTICQDKERRGYRIIELKDERMTPKRAKQVVEQVEYYVNWASQSSGRHLDGAFNWNTQPIIVAPPCTKRSQPKVFPAFRTYNDKRISLPLRYVEFQVRYGQDISFQEVDYCENAGIGEGK